MSRLLLLICAAAVFQIASACNNCVVLGKEEKAMFRAHSDACLASSGAAPAQVAALLAGDAEDAPPLRRHVYCVLRRCKLVGKDGKMLKNAVTGKLASRPDGRNVIKVLESCSEQLKDAATPEDVAWNLFRCAYERKTELFAYMPTENQTTVKSLDL